MSCNEKSYSWCASTQVDRKQRESSILCNFQLDSDSQEGHLRAFTAKSFENRAMLHLKSIFLLLLLPLVSRVSADPAATSIGVFVDGSKNPLYDPEITVPPGTSNLRFFVQPGSERMRYRLSSVDAKWLERTDEMLFIIRFLNKNRDPISQVGFPAVGQSPGWKGSWEKSTFTPRREMVTVPPDAEFFYVVISSAGPAALVGVFAVSGINIQSIVQQNETALTYLRDSRHPESLSKIWSKSGTHSSMASALNLDDGSSRSPILIIKDDDLKGHADWSTGTRSLPNVVPGDQLEVQWNEAYSAGVGGPFSVVHERLPAGLHRFEAEELSITGNPLGHITRVSVTIRSPYWKKPWFWAASVSLIAVLSTLGGRYLIRKKIARHLEEAQLISDERLRIARDLHDDLGTRLSHISLLSAFAESHSSDREAGTSFGQISAMSRELIGALSETVWMLNPNNNQLEALVDFLCRLVSELCRLAEIRCRIDALSVTEDVAISHEFRHNISLAVKEVVNNALKHSRATETSMTIRVEGKLLIITVTDNGIGMTQSSGRQGLGLESITQRMATIRGKCDIQQIESGGIKFTLQAPIT
jgi:signal transduction histidine kinase